MNKLKDLVKKELKKAAKKISKETKGHFRAPKNKKGEIVGGWPLRFSPLIDDVFHEAFKFHIESIYIEELSKIGKFVLYMENNQLLIDTKNNYNKRHKMGKMLEVVPYSTINLGFPKNVTKKRNK